MSAERFLQQAEAAMSATVVTMPEFASWAAEHLDPAAFACEELRALWVAGSDLLREGAVPGWDDVAARAGVDPLWWQALLARVRAHDLSPNAALVVLGRAPAVRQVRDTLTSGLMSLEARVAPWTVARFVERSLTGFQAEPESVDQERAA